MQTVHARDRALVEMDEPTHQQGAERASTAPPRFSIFIPTYNRAHLLPRALESIAAQTCRDFEVVIVDDGSTDGTAALVAAWQARGEFPIAFRRQENQGKHGAHNTALPFLRGELTVILDSDDLLVPDALERLGRHWDAIPLEQRPTFSGVEGLSAFFDGRLNGSGLPQAVLDADYLALRRRHGVRGDMKGCVRTDLLRRFPYPRFAGERHIRPSLLWNRIGREYRTRFVNEVIQRVEFQPGGLSSNRLRLRTSNPRGFRHYYLEEARQRDPSASLSDQLAACADYVRYSLHAGIGPARQARDLGRPWLWLASLPRGTVAFLADRAKLLRAKA